MYVPEETGHQMTVVPRVETVRGEMEGPESDTDRTVVDPRWSLATTNSDFTDGQGTPYEITGNITVVSERDLVSPGSKDLLDSIPAPIPDESGVTRPHPAARPPGLPLPAPPSKSSPVRHPGGLAGPGRVIRARAMPLRGTGQEASEQLFQRREPSKSGGFVDAPKAKGAERPERPERPSTSSRDRLAPLQKPLVGGRYRIVERIGAGGMGKVFKVIHGRLGKTFALKIIRDKLAGDNKARDLFYREARLASSLSHPNIASVVDFGEDERLGAFMVMEFLQGEPLAKLLHREKQLSIRPAFEIIQQVAEALHYIHGKGIVHCDIKTENILQTEVPAAKRRKLQVKLLDFGLARSTAADRSTNSLAGTPHYVAPERIRGEDASPASDIYGLGILFYELLTGKVPWDGTMEQILQGHLNQIPTPPSELIEDGLDPAVEKLILRALAKTPDQRHKDIAAFLYELRTVMDMLGYGRRKRGGRRVVIERSSSQRDETSRALFDACRVPMALINRAGVIQVANPAFAQFVMGVAVDVEGLTVRSTPLARVWATFELDLARACEGKSLRRTIEVDVAEPRDVRRLLLWLDPGLKEGQAIFGVHPLDG